MGPELTHIHILIPALLIASGTSLLLECRSSLLLGRIFRTYFPRPFFRLSFRRIVENIAYRKSMYPHLYAARGTVRAG